MWNERDEHDTLYPAIALRLSFIVRHSVTFTDDRRVDRQTGL